MKKRSEMTRRKELGLNETTKHRGMAIVISRWDALLFIGTRTGQFSRWCRLTSPRKNEETNGKHGGSDIWAFTDHFLEPLLMQWRYCVFEVGFRRLVEGWLVKPWVSEFVNRGHYRFLVYVVLEMWIRLN